jgi:hypothetical protein
MQLPERRSRDQAAVSDPSVQRDDVLQIREPGVDAQPGGDGGEIDQPTVAAHVLGHRDQQPAGPQHRVARRIHRSHRGTVRLAAGVPEIGRVAGVVQRRTVTQPGAGDPRGLVDHPGIARVRRRRRDQIHLPSDVRQQLGQLAGVADPHLSARPGGLVEDVVEVASRQVDPLWLEIHTDRAAAQTRGLNNGGAGAAHRIHDQAAGTAVGADDTPCQIRQHLARMLATLRQIHAGPLALSRGLRTRPHRQRHHLLWIIGVVRVNVVAS